MTEEHCQRILDYVTIVRHLADVSTFPCSLHREKHASLVQWSQDLGQANIWAACNLLRSSKCGVIYFLQSNIFLRSNIWAADLALFLLKNTEEEDRLSICQLKRWVAKWTSLKSTAKYMNIAAHGRCASTGKLCHQVRCVNRHVVSTGALCQQARCVNRHVVSTGTLCQQVRSEQVRCVNRYEVNRCVVSTGTLCQHVHCF